MNSSQQPGDPEKLHQKQMTLGVYVPLGVISILALAVGAFISVKSQVDATLSQTWAAIGLVLMILPMAIIALGTIAVLILAVYGMAKANRAVSPHLRTFRKKAIKVNTKVAAFADKTAQPIIKLGTIKSGISSTFSRLRRKM